jgi:hypothetical protein
VQVLSSVAPAVALVCGDGPAAVVPAAQANPPPLLLGKPFASRSTPYAESQKLLLGLDKLGFVIFLLIFVDAALILQYFNRIG